MPLNRVNTGLVVVIIRGVIDSVSPSGSRLGSRTSNLKVMVLEEIRENTYFISCRVSTPARLAIAEGMPDLILLRTLPLGILDLGNEFILCRRKTI